MRDDAFKRIMEAEREVYDEVDDLRARVLLAKAFAQLQSDILKRYDDASFFDKA